MPHSLPISRLTIRDPALVTVLALAPVACTSGATDFAPSTDPGADSDSDGGSTIDGVGEGGLCEGDEPGLERPAHWTRASHCKFEEADYELLFPDDQVRRLEIRMSSEDAQLMEDDLEALLGPFGGGGQPAPRPGPSTDPIYAPTSVTYGDHEWTEVAMRYKGNSSLKYAWAAGVRKLSFRLHFDHFADDLPELEDQRFWGFRELTFASAYKDSSFLRDTIAGEIFRDFDVPAARTSFVELWVDQGAGLVYWGVYVMIEDVSDELTQSQFTEGGNLYKPEGPGADWTYFDPEGFAKKSNEDEADWSDIEAAIAALGGDRSDASAWRAELESRFDVHHFLRFLAVNQTIQNWDAYGLAPHNYYVYADPEDAGRLTWIPWDFNLSFFEGGGDNLALSIHLDEVDGASWPLIRFILDDPEYETRYAEILDELADEVFVVDDIEARILALHELIAPYVATEVAPYTHLVDAGEFEASLNDSPTAILPKLYERRSALEDALELP